MSDYETILVERRDAVTLVTLNRPQALNALNNQVLSELIAAFTAYDADAAEALDVVAVGGLDQAGQAADVVGRRLSQRDLAHRGSSASRRSSSARSASDSASSRARSYAARASSVRSSRRSSSARVAWR